MWSSADRTNRLVPARRALFRGVVVGLTVLLVAACGFRPLYGTRQGGQPVKEALAAVEVMPIADRSGQLLRNALEHRMTRSGDAPTRYHLTVTLSEVTETLGMRKDATASRANLRMTAQWALTEGDKVLTKGTSDSIMSYNLLSAQYPTVVSEKDSRERGTEQLADDIARRVAVYFSGRSQAGK